MSDLPADLSETVMQRRRLLTRGAAVAAGAAAGAVALGVAGTAPAAAADGDTLKQGGSYTGSTTTTLVGGDASTPALRLGNKGGPALELASVGTDFGGDLGPGQLLATDGRILVGVDDGQETYTTALATLDDVSSTVAIPSFRLVDTRNGRDGILAVGGKGIDSAGRLRAGGYIDVLVDRADAGFTLDAAFLNLTSTGSTANGFLFAYPPGERPEGSTTSYRKGVTIANSCLAALGVVKTSFAVRIYSSATSHVVVDLTGAVVLPFAGPASLARTKKSVRRSAARRVGWKPSRRR